MRCWRVCACLWLSIIAASGFLCSIKKKTEFELKNNIIQNYPVFTYICTSIGETLDTYRFDDENNNDLHESVCKYNNYKNLQNKKSICEPFKSYFESDIKFKAIDIKEFSPDKSWIIENWWNEEEKISIGLRKTNESATIKEFISLINDTLAEIESFKEELECIN